ncbi:MAG: hypothetical protein EPN30_00770 [Actinomycetota bacterium]|nr:MAG: hypothetical protein EPN30_00770 [Actinomycetota bacterium]
MITQSLAVTAVETKAGSLFWQMLRAETKKLTRRKGVMAFTVIGTVGAIVITFAILEIYHLSNPLKYSPIGGMSGFNKVIVLLGQITIISASILGTTAGSQDMESGVIRDLIVTGRSRTTIFLLRIEGAAIVWLVPLIVAFLIGMAVVFGLAGGTKEPSLHLVLGAALYCIGVSLVYVLTAAGFASLFGTRGPAIAIMIGWTFVIEALLVNVSALGPVRNLFLTTAISALSPSADRARHLQAAGVTPSLFEDYVVIVAWPLIMNLLGWIRGNRLEA